MTEGNLFSRVYLQATETTKDSVRFRNRLAAYVHDNLDSDNAYNVIKYIYQETGSPVLSGAYHISDLIKFITKGETRDILDSITLLTRWFKGYGEEGIWLKFVERVFKEESLGYKIDPKGGVHYYVDEEFERNRFSAIAGLDDSKYSAIRAAYEAAYSYMDTPSDTKAAVRSMFEALEILVRQMTGSRNLSKAVIDTVLKEKCLRANANDSPTIAVVSGLLEGFGNWVNALHNYRHGQPDEDPVIPSENVAIYVLSSGSSYMRWLVSINNALSATQ